MPAVKSPKSEKAVREPVDPTTDPVYLKVKAKLGPIPGFLKLDCTKIRPDCYRVNVWVEQFAGEMGFIRTGRIANSFIASVKGDEVSF